MICEGVMLVGIVRAKGMGGPRTDWPSPPVHPRVVVTPAMAPPLGNWERWMFSATAATTKEAQRARDLMRCIVCICGKNSLS
jgi:hypothetical protein